jgi:hypothetical protein
MTQDQSPPQAHACSGVRGVLDCGCLWSPPVAGGWGRSPVVPRGPRPNLRPASQHSRAPSAGPMRAAARLLDCGGLWSPRVTWRRPEMTGLPAAAATAHKWAACWCCCCPLGAAACVNCLPLLLPPNGAPAACVRCMPAATAGPHDGARRTRALHAAVAAAPGVRCMLLSIPQHLSRERGSRGPIGRNWGQLGETSKIGGQRAAAH